MEIIEDVKGVLKELDFGVHYLNAIRDKLQLPDEDGGLCFIVCEVIDRLNSFLVLEENKNCINLRFQPVLSSDSILYAGAIDMVLATQVMNAVTEKLDSYDTEFLDSLPRYNRGDDNNNEEEDNNDDNEEGAKLK